MTPKKLLIIGTDLNYLLVDDYFCSGVEGVGFGYITNKKELNEEFGKENIFEVKDSMSILIRLTKDCLYYLTENPNERKIYN